MRKALFIAVPLFFSLCAFSADKRVMTYDDVLALKAVGSPAISPDGNSVLYTVREWESASKDPKKPGKEESKTHVWLVSAKSPTGEGAPHQVTFGDKSETNPAWSPDGRYISFLAARGKGEDADGPRQQVWIMRTDGGEAWQLTEAKDSVSDYSWSPDGRSIAYSTREPLPKEKEDALKRQDDPRIFEDDFRVTGLYAIDVASRKSKALTTGQSFTIEGEPSWSPDGKQIAFAAKPTPMIRDYRADIYLVASDGTGLQKITTNLGPDTSPRWSPDGSLIAYLSIPNSSKPLPDGTQNQEIGNEHLMLYHVATKESEDVSSPQFEFTASTPLWMPDSKTILFRSGDHVYSDVFAFDLATRKYRQVTHDRNVALPSSDALSRNGTVAFSMQSSSEPAEIYVAGTSFASPRKLTDTNPQVRDFALGSAEVVQWKSSDGWPIEGILLKPAGYVPGKRYPLLVNVHGGPTGAFTTNFNAEGQLWAGHGWAILYPNPRGSSNYGDKFAKANIHDWGGGDYHDIMTGVDAMVARGIADPDHMAEWGWSYGGYMTCWIVSQTGRFKAAMMGAGLSDLVSMYGTTDIPNYLATFWDAGPNPQNMKLYVERSGITYVDHVTTPLLILQGGSDERVPTSQSMEFYRALKDRGKTTQLVYYPREGHGLREYYHQYDRLKRTFEWINRYTLGDGASAAAGK